MSATTTISELKKALSDVDFPATKNDLLDHAQRNSHDEGTVRAIGALPQVDYAKIDDVIASIELTDVGGPGEDTAKAAALRHHEKSGLAERNRDVDDSPNPIVDELGENRYS